MPLYSTAIATLSAGGALVTGPGPVVLSNSNNVTFGAAGQTITASASVATSLTNIRVSAGTTSNLLSAITFADGGGISFGIAASVITATVVPGAAAGIGALAAGSQTATSGTVVFSNSNNITFGMSGSSRVTASYALSGDRFNNMGNVLASGSAAIGGFAFTGSHRSLFLGVLAPNYEDNNFPFDLTASTCFLNLSVSGSTATMSVAHTSIWFLGIYTKTGQTLNLLNSVSVSHGFAAAATNNSTAFVGQRYLSIHSSAWSVAPEFRAGSDYFLGWFWSSAGALNQSCSIMGAYQYSTVQRSGTVGTSVATATSMGWKRFYGVYTATTAAFPAAITNSQLNKVNANAAFIPQIMMFADTAHTAF